MGSMVGVNLCMLERVINLLKRVKAYVVYGSIVYFARGA